MNPPSTTNSNKDKNDSYKFKKDKNQKARKVKDDKLKDDNNKKKVKKEKNEKSNRANNDNNKLNKNRIIIRKLPSTNYNENDFKSCIERVVNLIGLDMSHFIFEHFVTGIYHIYN